MTSATTEQQYQILIVEDDLNLGFLLLDYLEEEGFQAKLCRDGSSGLEQFKKRHYDLCILDVMMPKMDGFELARRLRNENPTARFLFLSARAMKLDKMRGYALGAEDYLTKPFDQDELLCKIKAILRRTAAPTVTTASSYQIGRYHFSPELREISIDDKTIRLTEKENDVLTLLCKKKEQILKRDVAVELIYGKRDYFLGRSFDVFISRLRKHLRYDTNVKIENVYKVGFILTDSR